MFRTIVAYRRLAACQNAKIGQDKPALQNTVFLQASYEVLLVLP